MDNIVLLHILIFITFHFPLSSTFPSLLFLFFISFTLTKRFDGPDHFTRPCVGDDNREVKNEAKIRALGHTVLKYRLLKHRGKQIMYLYCFCFCMLILFL